VLLVDELIAEQHTLVKSLGRRLIRVPCISGATVLATGHIALVLHTADVVRRALREAGRQPRSAAPAPRATRRRVIVADDTLTTRTLEKAILEKAGYEVRTAVDGAEAWQLLQTEGADLLVSDVEMPRMDGFALTEAVRASPRFKDLPVVLVTGLANDIHMRRGVEVGADAYLVKGVFDQAQFLEIIAQLL